MTNSAAEQVDGDASVRLADHFEEWDRRRSATVTAARHKSDVTRYRRYILGRWSPDQDVRRLSAKVIQAWMDQPEWKKRTASGVAKDNPGPTTRYATLMTLRQILDGAVRAGVLQRNSADDVRYSAFPNDQEVEETDLLSADDAERIVNAFDDHYRPMAMLASRHAVSWQEALGLQVPDIDFRHNRIRLGRLLSVESNGRVTWKEGNPNDIRWIDITSDVAAALAAHIMATKDYRDEDEPWVFLTSQSTRPLRSNWNRYFLRPALERAGMDARAATYKTLRHTGAVRMLNSGFPVEQVAHILGHRSVETTKRLYRAHMPAQRKA